MRVLVCNALNLWEGLDVKKKIFNGTLPGEICNGP